MEEIMLNRIFDIQMFAEEESETTDENDEEVEEEAEVEYTDSEGNDTETSKEEVEEETTEEPEEKAKTFTQEELDSIIEKRVKRERNKLDREYESELSKYKELEYLARQGLEAENLDEVLEKSRAFYGKQGIIYKPERSNRELEILANAEAQDIIDGCSSIEDLQFEADRLLERKDRITPKEKLVLTKIVDEMNSKHRIHELTKMGVKAEVYNSKEFKDFEKKFDKHTEIKDIYELFRIKTKPTKRAENPGSMKTVPSKAKKEYITEAEYDRMTEKEIEENMDLIMKSMKKW